MRKLIFLIAATLVMSTACQWPSTKKSTQSTDSTIVVDTISTDSAEVITDSVSTNVHN